MTAAILDIRPAARDLAQLFTLDRLSQDRRRLVCHWHRDGDGRLACVWEPDMTQRAGRAATGAIIPRGPQTLNDKGVKASRATPICG